MERLGDGVRSELRRFSGPQGEMPAIVSAWPAAVGPEVARNAWPARVDRDGVLRVHTSSSAWAFELTQLAATVVAQLRAALGDRAPQGLRFAPGLIPEAPRDEQAEERRSRVEPTPESRAAGDAVAAGIDDEELRKQVARAASLSLELARADRRF
jgi:hypothetical protein